MSAFDQQIVFLPVADLDVSEAFYAGLLGLEPVLDQGRCRIYRSAAEAYVGICRRDDPLPAPGVILTLVTEDVDAWHDRLVAAGAPVDAPPRHNAEYGIYQFFVADPDGHQVEIQRFE